MKKHLLLPGLLLTALTLQLLPSTMAQPSRRDSARVFEWLDQAGKLRERLLLDSARRLCDQALQTSLHARDSFLVAMAYYGLGQIAQAANHKDEAMTDFRRALSASLEKDQSIYTAGLYNDIGYLYGTRGELDAQRDWYLKAMRLYDEKDDVDGMAQTLSNLSGSSLELGKKQEAIEYARRALAIRQKGKDLEALALSYNNLSQIYLQADSLDQAVRFQQEGMRYAALSGSRRRLAQSYTGMSLLMNRQKKNSEALEYEKKAIALCRETNDSIMLSRRCISAAFLSGQLKDSAGAVTYFNEAEKILKASDDKYNLRDLFLYRTVFYKERKDYYHAYEDLKQYHAFKDSIIDAETASNIAEIQARYETEKKDKAIGELRAGDRIKDQQLRLAAQERTMLIGGIIFLLVTTWVLFNRYQLKKKLQQQQALLEIRNKIARDLHDEIGSTLTSIQILSQVSRNHLGEGQAGASTLLQKITEQSGQMQQSMSDIVWAIRSDNDKVENMIVRMREYLTHTLEARNIVIGFQAGEELLDYSFTMQQRKDIFLIFKEAVNNAAKYAGCTRMDISFRHCGDRILLEIKDNGIGFNPGEVRSSNGLKNMQTRADYLAAGFSIQTAPGKGTMVRLDLPVTT